MDNEEKKGRELSSEEAEEMQLGFDLEEMTKTAGWSIIEGWFEQRSHHAWVDPRGMKKEEWEWAELNAFHSADLASQTLEDIEKAINRAHYLHGVKLGEIKEAQRMRI